MMHIWNIWAHIITDIRERYMIRWFDWDKYLDEKQFPFRMVMDGSLWRNFVVWQTIKRKIWQTEVFNKSELKFSIHLFIWLQFYHFLSQFILSSTSSPWFGHGKKSKSDSDKVILTSHGLTSVNAQACVFVLLVTMESLQRNLHVTRERFPNWG